MSNDGASGPELGDARRCQASALQRRPAMGDPRVRRRSDRLQRLLGSVRNRRRPLTAALEKFSSRITTWTGSSSAFALAVFVILVWAVTGPIFHFSDTWQLVINTTTTVVTFLMVFLIQRAQSKGVHATYIKLNELIASIDGASNRLIEVEDLSEAELEALRRHFRHLVEMAARDGSLTRSHSIEEATERHRAKTSRRSRPVGAAARPAGPRRRNGAPGRGPRTA